MLSSDTDSDEPAHDAPPLPSVHAQQPDLRRELSAPHTPTPLARPLRRLPTSAPHGRPSSPHVPSPPVPMSAPSRLTYLERATFISPYGLSARAAHFPPPRSHAPQRDAALLTSPSPHALHYGRAAPPTPPSAAPLAEAASPAPTAPAAPPALRPAAIAHPGFEDVRAMMRPGVGARPAQAQALLPGAPPPKRRKRGGKTNDARHAPA
jgi:hypothetical protein